MTKAYLPLIAYALILGSPSAAPAQRPAPPDEQSVRPGVNDKYLDPQLNVDEWVQRFELESREVYRARHAIVEALGLKPGERVADVGAGTGLFTPLLASKVGPQGWVYAVDIAPKFVERIQQVALESKLANVTPVLGDERRPRLPPECVDCVLICDVYHHFEYPLTTMTAVRAALKPGGRLVVADFERIPGVSSEWTLGHVRAGKEVFRKEIQAAGFRLVAEREIEGLEENYCLEFTKPMP
ncbi:MAG: methyltransferase domain-containing protein, partial [Myxococcales bacterium]|nr:methyltransferase domain-containing protein [Myxococcales bacterium]